MKKVSIYSGLFCEYPGFNYVHRYIGEKPIADVLTAIENASAWDEEITVGETVATVADMLYSIADELDITPQDFGTFDDLQSAIESASEAE